VGQSRTPASVDVDGLTANVKLSFPTAVNVSLSSIRRLRRYSAIKPGFSLFPPSPSDAVELMPWLNLEATTIFEQDECVKCLAGRCFTVPKKTPGRVGRRQDCRGNSSFSLNCGAFQDDFERRLANLTVPPPNRPRQ
jgi:hypothetical protein